MRKIRREESENNALNRQNSVDDRESDRFIVNNHINVEGNKRGRQNRYEQEHARQIVNYGLSYLKFLHF